MTRFAEENYKKKPGASRARDLIEPYPSEKYDFVNWDDDIPNISRNTNSCSKPPTKEPL